jgi:hypothetical protein
VVLFPPDNDSISDEDSDDEETTLPKDLNHLGRGILTQQAELIIYQDEELPDISTSSSGIGDVAPPSKRTRRQKENIRVEDSQEEDNQEEDAQEEEEGTAGPSKLGRVHNKDRKWTATKPPIFGMSVPEFQQQPLKKLPEDTHTPYDFYKLFVDDLFVEKVVKSSKLYAERKGRPEIQQKINSNSLRICHGIMYMTGYITPANRNMYWEKREDTSNSQVKRAMPQRVFSSINSNTVFVESEDPDPTDKFWKVRLLFQQLNKTAKQYVKHPEKVSIDEAMIKYYGPHPLKQFMRGKPHHFGYKVGYLYTI